MSKNQGEQSCHTDGRASLPKEKARAVVPINLHFVERREPVSSIGSPREGQARQTARDVLSRRGNLGEERDLDYADCEFDRPGIRSPKTGWRTNRLFQHQASKPLSVPKHSGLPVSSESARASAQTVAQSLPALQKIKNLQKQIQILQTKNEKM